VCSRTLPDVRLVCCPQLAHLGFFADSVLGPGTGALRAALVVTGAYRLGHMTVEALADSRVPRATLSAVAAEAGVSISTVSKVLNGRPGVLRSTRARVEKLLQDQGYNRRGEAKAAPLIELVFSLLTSEWAIEIIRGVEGVARENGMSIVLTQTGDRHSPGLEWIAGVLQRRPLGVILIFSDLSDDNKSQLRIRNIPFVVIDPAGNPGTDVPSVGSANWAGGVLATRHLIELGHDTIAMISGPNDMMCSRARVSGYRSALEEAGIRVREDLILSGEFRREDGIRLGRDLLSRRDRPTAIFAGNDMQALGVYEVAREMEIDIPRELSVVGYDDLKIAQWVGPPLTTVRQPLTEMAEQATRLVIRLRQHAQGETMRVELGTDLVVRGSTAKPFPAT
jgi:LacI family transcriptional regulator, xylobiose transport system transcriptional regulator